MLVQLVLLVMWWVLLTIMRKCVLQDTTVLLDRSVLSLALLELSDRVRVELLLDQQLTAYLDLCSKHASVVLPATTARQKLLLYLSYVLRALFA